MYIETQSKMNIPLGHTLWANHSNQLIQPPSKRAKNQRGATMRCRAAATRRSRSVNVSPLKRKKYIIREIENKKLIITKKEKDAPIMLMSWPVIKPQKRRSRCDPDRIWKPRSGYRWEPSQSAAMLPTLATLHPNALKNNFIRCIKSTLLWVHRTSCVYFALCEFKEI